MIPNHGPTLEFGLGETADAIRETTARFAADKIAPLAAQIDESNIFPRELWPSKLNKASCIRSKRNPFARKCWLNLQKSVQRSNKNCPDIKDTGGKYGYRFG